MAVVDGGSCVGYSVGRDMGVALAPVVAGAGIVAVLAVALLQAVKRVRTSMHPQSLDDRIGRLGSILILPTRRQVPLELPARV